MTTLNINGQRVTVGDEFLQLSPEQQNATVDEIAKGLKPQAPQGFMANTMDFLKSIPRGLISGATSAQNPSFVPMEDVNLEMAPIREGARQTLINQTYAPQGPVGKIGEGVGEGLGNPYSYLGPGGPLLKIGGAALSGGGGEAAAQGAEALGAGAGAQTAARLGGAVLGGVTAGKAFGPGAPRAATPTMQELETASVKGGQYGGYKAAAASGLEIDPRGVAGWAADVGQRLYNRAFSGGKDGTAPQTFAVLEGLQNPPAGAIIGPVNLAAIKDKFQTIAQEVRPTQGGAMVRTKDAAAATEALERLREYVENIPKGHILAGDARAFSNAITEANANNAAFQRVRDFDARLTKAERATDRQIAGSLDAQIKTKAGQLYDRARGLNEQEMAQLALIERGGPASNTLRQLGRGGAGVIPLGTQAALALATGGAHLVPQAFLATALYGARKASEAITKSRAEKLVEMMAQRSPEYEQRLANLPPPDLSPGTAAILRALLAR